MEQDAQLLANRIALLKVRADVRAWPFSPLSLSVCMLLFLVSLIFLHGGCGRAGGNLLMGLGVPLIDAGSPPFPRDIVFLL